MPIRELKFRIRVVYERDEDGGFMAYCPDFPGLAVEGESVEDLKMHVQDAIKGYLLSLMKHNDPLPIGIVESDVTHNVIPFLWRKIAQKLGLGSKHKEFIQDVSFFPDTDLTFA
jgi:predicted RNase H-like HicB family nuclease